MADFQDKKAELYRYFPSPFYKLKSGQGIGILLDAFGDQLEYAAIQMGNYRNQYILATSQGVYLNVQGFNRDVYRPAGFRMTDDTYRELIRIITNSSKNIELIFERIIALFFGENAQAENIATAYAVRPNLIYVEIKEEALIIASSRDLYGTTYLHYSPTNGYNGINVAWTGVLSGTLAQGATVVPMVIPPGMPNYGNISFGNVAVSQSGVETKKYEIISGVVTLLTPISRSYSVGQLVMGPETPDNYPSAYMYDRDRRTDLVGSVIAGATTLQIGINLDRFPLEGVCYIGDPSAPEFEAKAFSRPSLVSTTLTLEGGTAFAHPSGDPIQIPNFIRNIKTTLNQNITAGQSFSTLDVINSADFPLERQAVFLNYSYDNQETVPFITRVEADNTKMQIDPDYVFKEDHSIGEVIHLCARKTVPAVDGTDFAFFLNDTAGLRNRFFDIIERIKATGMKLNIQII